MYYNRVSTLFSSLDKFALDSDSSASSENQVVKSCDFWGKSFI